MESDEPVLRVVPMRENINSNGHIFGGWILSQMDIAAGITASRRAKGPVATVAVDAMKFIRPMLIGDIISVYTDIERIGRTSMAIHVRVEADRRGHDEPVPVTHGVFTFVAIDHEGRPRVVEPERQTV